MIDYTSELTEEFLRTGKCASCPIIDLHAHMFNCYECPMLLTEPEQQLAAMDRSNVALALFCSHDALYVGPTAYERDIAVAKRWPDRFRMYQVVYSPDCDPARDLAMWEANDVIAGFKFHGDTYRVPISDPRHTPYWEFADARKLPVLNHTWGGSPYNGVGEAEKILDRYHDLTFIAGHSFRGEPKEAIRLAQKYPNLVLELTAVLSQQGMVDSFVDAGLEDRIVFGVDAPWFSYPFGIGALLSAQITDEVRRKILYKNALTVLRKANTDLPDNLKHL